LLKFRLNFAQKMYARDAARCSALLFKMIKNIALPYMGLSCKTTLHSF